jgi:hypothetical protein
MSDPLAERGALRRGWLAAAEAEIERREREALTAVAGDSYRSLMLTLDGMAGRMTAAPDYRPPAPHEQRRNVRTVERWLCRWRARRQAAAID